MADDLIRKSDVLETYADLYDIFDDNKTIQEELHKVFDKINNIPVVESNNSEIPNNCELQTIRCPKCGRTDYIRDMEKDMGIKGSHYKYKCINCNTYIKDEPTISKMEQVDKPQTCDTCKYGEDKHRYAHICNECGVGINNYEPKDEPQTADYCDVCNHKGCDNCIADGSNSHCVPSNYEPRTEGNE